MLSHDERRQYAVKQYESLRAEMILVRQTQQAILQWTQAVSAALFAAALVAATAHPTQYLVAAQLVLGAVVPLVLLGGALAWSGELIRLTRQGVFLRAFERATWADGEGDPMEATSLFIWENFAWFPPEPFSRTGFRRRQNAGYVGIAAFFGMMYVGSSIAFWVISPWALCLCVSIPLAVLSAVVLLPSAMQLSSLNSQSLMLTKNDLETWRKDLKDAEGVLPQSASLKVTAGSIKWITNKIIRRTSS